MEPAASTHTQLFKVLEQIRLPLISPSYYRHTVIESLDVEKEHRGCQRFISEAKDQPFCNTARPRRTAGGIDGDDVNWGLNTMECYDPETNQWTVCAPMQERRFSGHSAVVVDGKIYVLGGVNGENDDETLGRLVRTIERCCEETDTWETVGQMPNVRHQFSCVSFKLRKDCAAIVD